MYAEEIINNSLNVINELIPRKLSTAVYICSSALSGEVMTLKLQKYSLHQNGWLIFWSLVPSLHILSYFNP